MRKTTLPLLLIAATLLGCSNRAPLSPAGAIEGGGPHTFVIQGALDPRLPAPAAEASDAGAPAEPQVGGRHRGPRSDDPASFWNRMTTELGLAAKLPPPALSRAHALTQVAIYDGLVAAADARRGNMRANTVAAGAASEVLSYLFPAAADRIRAQALAQGDLDHARGVSARAWALGQAVGRLVVDHGKHDGSDAVFTGTMPSGPGIWTGSNPVLPMCGTWQCWITSSGSEFQPEPPYAYGSPEDLADVEKVVEVTEHLTAEQIAIVHKWADLPPPTIWNGMLLERVADLGLDAFASARAFAYLNAAMYDAFVSCWKTKYTYWTARPFQRISGLVTVIPTPNFPTYTSGHSTISGAAAQVMGEMFPRERRFFDDQAQEAAVSRLLGGIHFPHDNDQGLIVGHHIGERAVALMRRDRG